MFNVKPRPSGKMLKSLREEIEKIFFLQKILKIKNKKHFINTKKPSGEIFGTLFTPPRGASFNQKRC